MKNKVWIGIIAVVVLVVGWAAFRPELLFVNKTVNETLPVTAASAQGDSPTELAMGSFHGVAHETKGTASLYQLEEGKRVLRLSNFETSNGPDVRVFLIGANDAKDNAAVKSQGFIELGSLKGNKGDQNYDIPADVDLSKYNAVTIWCNRFNVNFATAPLSKQG